ncbi:bifunctional UDP-N-acetylglucosamine diphosphorylase/glucosamine-1-phosphate N-acetyltransferase GlmU [Gluconobacter kondonii]|uniref:bifunctional UDP-N-acetylglucosamine diphosphorylase/glucosamine-1-phosphate N-acetyltransferase GlmU n=1 Tax=Gluconobacter kondonii TaxID=941463 RepID=UPI001B8C7BD3|nr:bifunctional UDP-N-acetylglucosamine diphosphorylase/glucosamine-1-phosphate N-acetyltransferase GlmU [Gluconobacter kondonii]MBS1065036.1 bifunctional UDP-N-acetylglucosamine diphosphorylase/glucosamine-1-phosphate N-acetyltransferase GlmU [Gluconobacter kondonii]MBS1079336.1 bifunctional UDP-N-acetylglucosamine diphosphorylase/glucosamine-1-phosphate N-acetyltransferase GlmU [Gluconobacter kondonii]MBS1083001.1 bifunctional UDP-N-acetylglucosamine diphosphorylase/glucosamine-1-phosphate N-a
MTDTTHRTTAIILAAGLGTRMKSRLPKALHRLGNQPMINHLITTARQVFDDVVVVTGPDMRELEEAVRPFRTVTQVERLGTAHAANAARDLFGDGDIAVLYADNPLITAETMKRLLATRRQGASLALLGMRPAVPGRYGRIVEDSGKVVKIVEFKDATEDERRITLCNAGVMCAGAENFRNWLENVRNDNAQGEYYLTDVVEMAAKAGSVFCVEAPEDELAGVNSRSELARAEATLQTRLRNAAMDAGVTLVAPETVFFSTDTVLESDVTVEPNVFFGPGVTVRSGALIRAFSHLEGCTVGEAALIGPYARLRPGTVCAAQTHVGNFVELKNVELGEGAKANHLTYLGDASVGRGTNVGAGTITCNYDGVFKHRTIIGERVFVGSDAILVAPVTIGDDALVGAGSVITDDVPAGDLALGRTRQTLKAGRGLQIKQSLKARKEQG